MNVNSKSGITISLAELFYYLFFVLLLFAKCVGLYDGQPAFKILLVLALAAWAVKMWLTDYSIKELICIAILLGLGGLVYLTSGEKGALLYMFMITGLKNVPIKRAFAVGATVWSGVFLLFSWLNALHLLESPFKVHDKFGLGPVIRWGLGYSHPNVLHVSYLVLVMFLVYVIGEKYNWKHAIGFMLGNALVFLYSLSSTGVIAVTFYLGLSLYGNYKNQLNNIEKVLIQAVLPVCVLFSLIAPLVLQGRAFEDVNNLTNTRLNLAKYFLTLQPPTLFGTRVANLITSQLTMDNSYVNAFVTYGVVLFTLIIGFYLALIYKCCKEQRKGELCIIMTCLVAGITEPFLFNTSFKNISLLFAGMLLFDEKAIGKIHFSKLSSKTFTFSLEGLMEKVHLWSEQLKRKKRILILAAVLGCVIGCSAFQVLKQDPQRILVPESACDVGVLQRMGDELVTVDLAASQIPQSDDEIYGGVDETKPMIVFGGNMIWLEHLRDMLCAGITCGVVLVLLVSILSGRKQVVI